MLTIIWNASANYFIGYLFCFHSSKPNWCIDKLWHIPTQKHEFTCANLHFRPFWVNDKRMSAYENYNQWERKKGKKNWSHSLHWPNVNENCQIDWGEGTDDGSRICLGVHLNEENRKKKSRTQFATKFWCERFKNVCSLDSCHTLTLFSFAQC